MELEETVPLWSPDPVRFIETLTGHTGDLVRPGHEAAVDAVVKVANREAAEEAVTDVPTSPFIYHRDGDRVMVSVHFHPQDLTPQQIRWVERCWEVYHVNHVRDDLFEPHMMAVHFDDTDDCVCDDCWPLEERPGYRAGASAAPTC